jgi:cytochrome bd ubiquinol oxidase subunit II
MLLALVFRGVAFEFRYKDAQHRTFWDYAFCDGSAVAVFAQGVMLGAFGSGVRSITGPRQRPLSAPSGSS